MFAAITPLPESLRVRGLRRIVKLKPEPASADRTERRRSRARRARGDLRRAAGGGARPPSDAGAEWFPGTHVNYAEHVFGDRRDDQVAILAASELRALEPMSWGELRTEVARVAAGLRELGVSGTSRSRGSEVADPEVHGAMRARLDSSR